MAKGGVTEAEMLWEASHLPPFQEHLILMDKAGKACDSPFGSPCEKALGGRGILSWASAVVPLAVRSPDAREPTPPHPGSRGLSAGP